jgi:predicted nuclease of predicted toxin-antitoxin system
MKILLDAQLPRSLVPLLQAEGCDTLHTLDLPDGNRSSDATISKLADQQGRVVFSKDADFIQSHLLQGTPKQLLVIATGNIRNPELKTLLLQWLPSLRDAFRSYALIELQRSALIIRR